MLPDLQLENHQLQGLLPVASVHPDQGAVNAVVNNGHVPQNGAVPHGAVPQNGAVPMHGVMHGAPPQYAVPQVTQGVPQGAQSMVSVDDATAPRD